MVRVRFDKLVDIVISRKRAFSVLVLIMTMTTSTACDLSFQKNFQNTLFSNYLILKDLSSCKSWSLEPGIDINTLVTSVRKPDSEDEDNGVYNLEILLTEAKTGKVVSRISKKNALVADAVQIAGVEIVTDIPVTGNRHKFFGVKVAHRGSSPIFGYEESGLSLYLIDRKNNMQEILTNLIISQRNLENGSDSPCPRNPWSEIKRTLTIESSSSTKIGALHISETLSSGFSMPKNGDCIDQDDKILRNDYSIEFKNGHYLIPKEMQYR